MVVFKNSSKITRSSTFLIIYIHVEQLVWVVRRRIGT